MTSEQVNLTKEEIKMIQMWFKYRLKFGWSSSNEDKLIRKLIDGSDKN